ncbi:ATP-dependent protease [Shewanella sp. 3B26]|uniref:ATP-dependent protease n=1 Tax=Shewanella zhuhaiensis TaxID=2919576 RepID=A0AAJ1F1T0_9GAMM|nr:LON peptidase substrate-binding domain-containing protein [Shewanella zhuhaiensis]MCH4295837.1 ATP-dependent protease [Shewanella zhuhaiensis]
MQSQEMALLIHDALLLPDGRLELRIVEPRYLRMVAEVYKGYYPLAFAMHKANGHPPCYPEATQCEIIDFNQLEDDSLSIIVEGRQRLEILLAHQEKDLLWKVQGRPCHNWEKEPIDGEFEIISAALEQFYQVNPDLFGLYSDVHLEDAAWVSQRWLEVLPMYSQDKFKLANQPDCHKAMDFVLKLIKSHAG